jgi:hypothetical protein
LRSIATKSEFPPTKSRRRRDEGKGCETLAAWGGEDQEDGVHGEESEVVTPEMRDSRAAKDDAAGDVNEVSGGDEI